MQQVGFTVANFSALPTGGFFLIGGVMLFFDRAIANPILSQAGHGERTKLPSSLLPDHRILFLIGLTIIIGPQKTLLFFARKQKAKGTAAFFGGLTLILLRWPLIGFCVELYGIMVLFGDFLGTIAAFARNIPVIGPYIGTAVDRSGVGRRNAELPV
ncbi:Got1-like family protein [Colletotrichum cuscutae]|uniref:Got1-like family protein n=1 Tax=Colletotrichum cuscutae TaxID=1209917 RepID=A0AAI9V7L8_9PEZI|nr:Got1-like family protein [Colletotrichum cuscutae]